uniref:Hematopoietic cell signal transducer n=1 Tax=Stegastes partitus TaxID=144197 RepID=A0A3B4ZKA5_9TELE
QRNYLTGFFSLSLSHPTSFCFPSVCRLTVVVPDATVSCYKIEPGTIAGIICADVLLTLIIVAVTYRCASFRRRKIENANKVYMNVRDYCKS